MALASVVSLSMEAMETRIKNAVLDLVDEPPVQDHRLKEIVDTVSHQLDVPKAAVKTAIWELYSDGAVGLTPDWDLRGTRNHADTAVIA
jgi:hypothetical protein